LKKIRMRRLRTIASKKKLFLGLPSAADILIARK
jgi:hypothetical protein